MWILPVRIVGNRLRSSGSIWSIFRILQTGTFNGFVLELSIRSLGFFRLVTDCFAGFLARMMSRGSASISWGCTVCRAHSLVTRMSAGAHVTVIADHVTSLWWRIILKEKSGFNKKSWKIVYVQKWRFRKNLSKMGKSQVCWHSSLSWMDPLDPQ